jgi:hypothetical protein
MAVSKARAPLELPAHLDPVALAKAKAEAVAQAIGKFVYRGSQSGFTSSAPRELLGRAGGQGGSSAAAHKFLQGTLR